MVDKPPGKGIGNHTKVGPAKKVWPVVSLSHSTDDCGKNLVYLRGPPAICTSAAMMLRLCADPVCGVVHLMNGTDLPTDLPCHTEPSIKSCRKRFAHKHSGPRPVAQAPPTSGKPTATRGFR